MGKVDRVPDRVPVRVDRAAVRVVRDSVRAWSAVWPALRADLEAARADLDGLVAPLDAGEVATLLERIRREAADVDGAFLDAYFGYADPAMERERDEADFAALEARLCLAAFDALLERVLADGQRLDAVMREVARGR